MAAGKIKHVYFGPKDPVSGEPMDEPVYIHQELPRMLYNPEWEGWPLAGKLFNSDDEVASALKSGWVKSPADLGEVTAPSLEQVEAAKFAKIGKKARAA